MHTLRKRFLLILFLIIGSIFVSLPKQINLEKTIFSKPIKISFTRPNLDINLLGLKYSNDLEFNLGLDLSGGTQITLEANMENIPTADKKEALSSLSEVISRRVDLFGVTEPSVRTQESQGNHQIVVELPGLSDPKEALKLLGSTAKLEFGKPVYQVPEASPSAQPQFAGFNPTDLTGADLKRSSVTFDQQSGGPVVSIEFNEAGTKKFADLTKELIGKPLAIFLDDQLVTAPMVQTEILTGQAVITGSFTTEEAKTLSTQLNAGALPVPVEVVSQQNIAPTLGADSINKSIRAGLIGLGLVILFISVYYSWLGVIASLGLVTYGLLSLSLYKLAGITLTLPGIAGFILSVGMAVDSNILIFERYKEEIKAGRAWTTSLELAFGRAWDSIKDANTTTIITALILFNPLNWSFLPTSGPVRGFALTLLLGVALSMFTGLYVTRTLLRLFYHGPRLKNKNK